MRPIFIMMKGDPTGKGRPRFYHGHAVTPKKTAKYEKQLRTIARETIQKPLDGPVCVGIMFEFSIPDSWTKKKKEMAAQNSILPTKKPDIDNCLKIVLDALNGVAWNDDSQVVHVVMTKVYTTKDPCVTVNIWPAECIMSQEAKREAEQTG